MMLCVGGLMRCLGDVLVGWLVDCVVCRLIGVVGDGVSDWVVD